MYWLITTIAFAGYTPDISKITVNDLDSCLQTLESAVIQRPMGNNDYTKEGIVIYSCVEK
jgi:hypothetical protein